MNALRSAWGGRSGADSDDGLQRPRKRPAHRVRAVSKEPALPVPFAEEPAAVAAPAVARNGDAARPSLVALPGDGSRVASAPKMFHDFARYWMWREAKDVWACNVPTRAELHENRMYVEMKSTGLHRLEEMERVLDQLSETRSEYQKKLHNEMKRALLFQLLGKDYDSHVDAVCAEYGWDGPKQELLALASRRSGKTFGIALFTAALVIVVPDLKVVIFSISMRQSQELLLLIDSLVMSHPKGRDLMIHPHNMKEFMMQGDTHAGDRRRVRSLPGTSDVKRVSVVGYGGGGGGRDGPCTDLDTTPTHLPFLSTRRWFTRAMIHTRLRFSLSFCAGARRVDPVRAFRTFPLSSDDIQGVLDVLRACLEHLGGREKLIVKG